MVAEPCREISETFSTSFSKNVNVDAYVLLCSFLSCNVQVNDIGVEQFLEIVKLHSQNQESTKSGRLLYTHCQTMTKTE